MPAAGPNVLPEAAAVEVLAYLITAARTQLDEAAEYAPLRLLTAAQRLAAHLAPHASTPVRPLIAALDSMPPTATPRDRDAYTAKLDEICLVLADCLLRLDPRVEER
jgi:nitroreductase